MHREVLARKLERVAGYIHAAFPVSGSDTGDYLVRNLVGIDMPRGWIAVAQPVAAGDRVLFCRRDPANAAADLTLVTLDLGGWGSPGTTPCALLVRWGVQPKRGTLRSPSRAPLFRSPHQRPVR